MKNARPTVSAMAISRTFQSGRPSVMSYAALSVLMIDTIVPELLQMAVTWGYHSKMVQKA